jgi:L-aspartate oxidase
VTAPSRGYDLAVVGSGIAGLYAAIRAHEEGRRVLLVTKGSIDEASTRYAQGGIAAAVGHGDDAEAHLRDTIEAGAGLVDEEAARIMVTEAAARIADLVRFGVRFDAEGGAVALGREAAHSASRILHAGGDATGLEIELSLSTLARRAGVTILEHTLAERLLIEDGRVTGIEALETSDRDPRGGRRSRHEAGTVVLATGGAGQLYRTTTNPDVSTGDGIALAYEAGAEVMDLEFTQFHPTVLRIPGQPVFLISEAVRGEGALLYNVRGERFLPRVDERAELAPRDVVALAIHREMRATEADHVLLDITGRDAAWLAARFPQIYRTCLEAGLDMATDRIPVSPAAHYTMGGVRTSSWGEATLSGLYAVGEVACTAVHGANRLASNSLLETVVFAHRAVERMWGPSGSHAPPAPSAEARSLAAPAAADGAPPTELPRVQTLRELMWSRVGIERDGAGLAEAARSLARWHAALGAAEGVGAPDRSAYELRRLVLCGRLAAEAALAREESRGAHYRADFPQPRETWRRHLVFRADAAGVATTVAPDAAALR